MTGWRVGDNYITDDNRTEAGGWWTRTCGGLLLHYQVSW